MHVNYAKQINIYRVKIRFVISLQTHSKLLFRIDIDVKITTTNRHEAYHHLCAFIRAFYFTCVCVCLLFMSLHVCVYLI